MAAQADGFILLCLSFSTVLVPRIKNSLQCPYGPTPWANLRFPFSLLGPWKAEMLSISQLDSGRLAKQGQVAIIQGRYQKHKILPAEKNLTSKAMVHLFILILKFINSFVNYIQGSPTFLQFTAFPLHTFPSMEAWKLKKNNSLREHAKWHFK